MKGHRSFITIQGNTMGLAEMRYTPNGRVVTSFPVGVGGNRAKGVKGVVFRCVAWEDNAERVQEVLNEPGLAVVVTGRITQRARQKNGNIYIDNDLNIDKLLVQKGKAAVSLTEVEIVRSFAKGSESKVGGKSEAD